MSMKQKATNAVVESLNDLFGFPIFGKGIGGTEKTKGNAISSQVSAESVVIKFFTIWSE